MNHQIENRCWYRKRIEIALDDLAGGILEKRIVNHEGDLVCFVVWIFNWGFPISDKGESMVSVTKEIRIERVVEECT
jgi:hypothetical protein